MEVYDFISETNSSQAVSQMNIVLKTATDSLSVFKNPSDGVSAEACPHSLSLVISKLHTFLCNDNPSLKNTNVDFKRLCVNMQMR